MRCLRIWILVTVAVALVAGHACADRKYLGRYSSNTIDSDSTSNPVGQYGSSVSPNSINNPVGQFGSPVSADSVNNPVGIYGSSVSSQSARNPLATDAPRVVYGDDE